MSTVTLLAPSNGPDAGYRYDIQALGVTARVDGSTDGRVTCTVHLSAAEAKAFIRNLLDEGWTYPDA